jgi:rRNA small subunit pseudouridine methyltransferase Nep1
MSSNSSEGRRRRYSGTAASGLLHWQKYGGVPQHSPALRPKSTPPDEERAPLRKRTYVSSSGTSTSGSDDDDVSPPPSRGGVIRVRGGGNMDDTSSGDATMDDKSQRPTRPIPNKTKSLAALRTNPAMLPVQAHVPRGPQASSQRRLFVILEQACLEAYRVGTVSKGRNGREGEAKYALLNCDDHQGILAKTGRDIADARPDITHQVCACVFYFSIWISCHPELLLLGVEMGVVKIPGRPCLGFRPECFFYVRSYDIDC